MNIKTYNKSLAQQAKKALNFAFVRETDINDEQTFFSNDTDCVKYRIVSKVQSVVLYFFATDVKVIWNYCHQHFKTKYYKCKDSKVALKNINNSDAVEIVIDNQSLTLYNQNYVSKGQTGIMTGKKKFDELFQYLSKKLASVKRHFFASPYQMMLDAVHQNFANKGNKQLPNLSYNVKPGSNQKIWISFQKNQFTVYYGVSFEDRSEQQLCKILLSELVDAKKHVHNPPSIGVVQSQLPKFLIQAFPEQKTKKYTFANGIVCLTIFGSMVKKPESIATNLAGFRSFVYYHIQAQKCYLHSRVLRRIGMIHKDLTHTKIQPFAMN